MVNSKRSTVHYSPFPIHCSQCLALVTVAATAAAIAAEAATTTTTTTAIFAGLCFVHVEVATVDLFAIKLLNSLRAFFLRRHLDEAEAA